MAASVGNEGDHMCCPLISETSWLVGPCRAVAKALYPERSHYGVDRCLSMKIILTKLVGGSKEERGHLCMK